MNRLLIFALLLLSFASCKTAKKAQVSSMTPDDEALTRQTVDINTIKGHIYFLASDEMAGRNTPSPELNIAAQYLATSLMRYGVQPLEGYENYLQPVPMKKISPAKKGHFEFSDQKLELVRDFIVLKGTDIELDAAIVFLGRGTNSDFEKTDVQGKIVIVTAGLEGQSNPQEWFFAGQDKHRLAAEKGAAALIELYASNQLPWNFLVNYLNQPQTIVDNEKDPSIPHIWLNAGNSEAISLLRKEEMLTGTLNVSGRKEEVIKTYNVVGMVEGTDPQLKEEYIIYSAHYDHVGYGRSVAGDSIYNGARDNAVGSVTVLSAAENLAKHPTKRSAIFIFFTGEEKGLLGSAYYADNPAIPLDQVVYCFNSDNGGYNDTSRASIIGLTRTGAQSLIERACSTFGLEAKEDSAPEEGLFDRSDNVNFARKGVPAPTFSLGFTSFDEEINRYYHQPGDEPATLDYAYLHKFFQSYVYACRLIANTNQSLFWNKGDKYYEAGKQLYGIDP